MHRYRGVFRYWDTQFGLVIGFIAVLHVVTTVTLYTVTHSHSLQSVHSNIPILFGASDVHLETADR
jgi:glucose uptake protein GlcU